MVKLTRFRRLGVAASVLVTAGALCLVGCSASSSGDPAASTGGTPAAGACGSVPKVGVSDPADLLSSLDADVRAGYNGYVYPVQKPTVADFKSPKTGGFTAAIVGQAPAAPFIATYEKQLADSLTSAGVDIVLNAVPKDPTDVPGQIQQFNQALALKPDIIFLGALAPESGVSLAKQAADAGIPVVAIITPLDTPNAVSLTFNAVLQSMQTTAAIAHTIGGKGSVLEVQGIPGIPTETQWEQGASKALALCPDINVAGTVQGLFQPPAAQQAVVQFLATNPAGVDAVLQAGTMGWAARDAFTQSGLAVPPIQDLGASRAMVAYAAKNPSYPYVGTVTPPTEMAKATAQVGLKILAGAGPKVNQIVNAAFVVDRSNLSKFEDPSWSIQDGTDLTGPDTYFTDAQIAQFFTNPKLGPQSAQ